MNGSWTINFSGQFVITINNGNIPFSDGTILDFTVYKDPSTTIVNELKCCN